MGSALDNLEEFLCRAVLNPPKEANKQARRMSVALRDTVSFLAKILRGEYNEITDEGEPDIDSLITATAAAVAFLKLATLDNGEATTLMDTQAKQYFAIFSAVSVKHLMDVIGSAQKG